MSPLDSRLIFSVPVHASVIASKGAAAIVAMGWDAKSFSLKEPSNSVGFGVGLDVGKGV